MHTLLSRPHLLLALAVLAATSGQVHADITVLVSVKFILNSDATHPAGNIGTSTTFQAEVDRGNAILAATGRGYQLQVVEYLDIQPAAPADQPANYWFMLPARTNRKTIESAARANTGIWRWHGSAINIYVNGSTSGQCSFVGDGLSISLGQSVGDGTVLHEIGHFFNLRHTHSGDYADNPATPPFLAADLRDGDGLAETARDNPNISSHDQLSQALFGHVYSAATAGEQAVVDSAYENVMSYHNENVFLPVQMDLWTFAANADRIGFCTGRTWFVAEFGNDAYPGLMAAFPFATVDRAVSLVGGPNDVILLRGGSYHRPTGNTISRACTLRATAGPVSIGVP